MIFRARWLLGVCLCLLVSGDALAQKPPEEELKALCADDNMEVSLFASEPMITNPSAIDIDTHGRVWVAEIQWYRGKAKQPAGRQDQGPRRHRRRRPRRQSRPSSPKGCSHR